ncbi:hypothetical protein AB0G35_29310 [Streptomyces sp. NPDC021749]|uniref:hypothetical protein n=1 Tax=Streptomyces sp. NPDC021749 TaxID=3154905 RepID=UPI0034027B0E
MSGGIATVTHTYSGTTGSPFTISAAYAGDVSFAASTGTDTHSLVNGRASAQFNPLSKGTHVITGNYNGDIGFAPSSGSTRRMVTN